MRHGEESLPKREKRGLRPLLNFSVPMKKSSGRITTRIGGLTLAEKAKEKNLLKSHVV